MLPPDIDPDSRCRLPLPKRDELDPARQEIFDRYSKPGARSLRGLNGPTGIRLHSKKLSVLDAGASSYLRFDSGLSPRHREVAILITARECDSRFEWAAHEPEGLKQGVPPETIDAIKHKKPLDGLDKVDALIVRLGREMLGARKVTPETYAAAEKQFGKGGLVDLVALMGNYSATAALLCCFDMQLDEGTTALLPVD